MFKCGTYRLHFCQLISADCFVAAHKGKHRDPEAIPNIFLKRTEARHWDLGDPSGSLYLPPWNINSLRQTNIRFIALGYPAICDGSAIGVAKRAGRVAKRAWVAVRRLIAING
jgi:hypothetical protein